MDKKAEINKLKRKDIIALIAYLQRLGVDIKNEKPVTNSETK